VDALLFAGAHVEIVLAVGESRFRGAVHVTTTLEPGTKVWISLSPAYSRVLRE
jgi:hypothetical protein